MATKYGLDFESMWNHAHPLAQGILIFLVLYSIVGVALSFKKLSQFKRERKIGGAVNAGLKDMLKNLLKEPLNYSVFSNNLQNMVNNLGHALGISGMNTFEKNKEDRTSTVQSLNLALVQIGHELFHANIDSLKLALESEVFFNRNSLQSKLKYIVGNLAGTAVFWGLLGTIVGIMRSFRDLSTANVGTTQAAMAGIAEALIATATGLVIAIIAVCLFNILKNKAVQIEEQAIANLKMILAIREQAGKDISI